MGQVLRAHGGEQLFENVEAMRRLAKQARESGDDKLCATAREGLDKHAKSLSAQEALEVVRAFTLYFQLVNQAEDVHRTRELRRREMEGGVVSESLQSVVAELRNRGATPEEIHASLADIDLRFVFTAHPTEARRRTTERLLSSVREVLERRDRSALTPTEIRIVDRHMRASIEALWEHATERAERPDVIEEVKAGLWYLRNVLLDAVPRLQRRLHRSLDIDASEHTSTTLQVPIRFGSWMGGDRDGNPFVNEAATERTLELQRRIILDRYVADLDRLIDPLAAAGHRLPAHTGLTDALSRAHAAVPEVAHVAERRNPNEPLRRLLTFMRERIVRTRDFAAGAYPDPESFLDDLDVIRAALYEANAQALPDHTLLDLIVRVRCFGFTLAAVDVREDSRVHRAVIGELLEDPSYPSKNDDERAAALEQLTLPERGQRVSPLARRLLDLFSSLGRLQARFGPNAVRTYIISMSESAVDVLEVLRLAELHGLGPNLDIVPLFETRQALIHASSLLETLFADPTYKAHLRHCGSTQEIILGYSDSMKESGILASRVTVLDAQKAAARVCAKHDLKLRLFHGRGGSVSRGGGPTYRAIGALPRDAFSGHAKITEQGETRSFHFANPDLAVRYLEQTLGAALTARYEARFAPPEPQPERSALLNTLATKSHQAYRELVESEGLIRYFQEATPFRQIAGLNIASRPAKRKKGSLALEDLRAIPWVFSWSQCRHVITGWYGVGTALSSVHEVPGGNEQLASLYRESPFFRDLLDNVEMTLAKTDLAIGARYADLCSSEADRAQIFGHIEREAERTKNALLAVSGQQTLLADDPVVRTSIELRNPYVDPLSYLQVEAMRKSTSDPDNPWSHVARAAVHGIAAGLRNTG